MANPEERLRKLLEEIAKRENYAMNNIEIKPITSGGANFTTLLYLATISAPNKPDLNLFAKVANLNKELRALNEMMSKVFLTESLFYSELVANFNRLYNKNNVPVQDRIVIPKYYGHNLIPYEETMVLENLEAGKYRTFDRHKTFNWEYASTAVTQLARFHAVGLAFRDESPTEFDRILGLISSTTISDDDVVKFMVHQTQSGCNEANDEYKAKLQIYFSESDRVKNIMDLMTKNTNVLAHRDFKPSNLMHRRVNGKLEILVLDFQTLVLGNAVADLMYFIFTGSDEEFRRLHYRRLLDHYFTELTLALRKLNLDVEKLYPKKDYERDLDDLQPIGLLVGLAMTSLITVAPEDAPEYGDDMVSLQVKPNQLAKDRINGVVRDFIKWGVL